MKEDKPQLILQSVSKIYTMGGETITALDNINLNVYRNDYIAVTGSSGSGKSTMMNILGCLDKPSSGIYKIGEEDTSKFDDSALAKMRNDAIGFIFQTFNLLPKLTALENVMQPLIYRRVPYGERRVLALEVMSRVGLLGRIDHLPNQLSGGQRQRVAIARALVGKPSILIADEPTGNLDSVNTREIMSLFKQLHKEGNTIVIVTHEPEIASECKRVLIMADGRIKSDINSVNANIGMSSRVI